MLPLDGSELAGCYGSATEHCTLTQGNSCWGVREASDLHTGGGLFSYNQKMGNEERGISVWGRREDEKRKTSGLLSTMLLTNDRCMHVGFLLVQTKYALFK